MKAEQLALLKELAEIEHGDFVPNADLSLVQRIAAECTPLLIWRSLDIAYSLGQRDAHHTVSERAASMADSASLRVKFILKMMED